MIGRSPGHEEAEGFEWHCDEKAEESSVIGRKPMNEGNRRLFECVLR